MNFPATKIDPVLLEQSRQYCLNVTRCQAKNFYYGLKLLPPPKRVAMSVLYAYMRLLDDIADQEDGRSLQQRIDDLEAWRVQTHAVINGNMPEGKCHQIWPAFADLAQRYAIPPMLFDKAIAGQQQDLQVVAFDNFAQLYEYCWCVAGSVGLASIYIWGFEGGKATEALAVDRGVAFQLTNIVRDLREDLAKGRIYLPGEELAAMKVCQEDLQLGRDGKAFEELMRFQIDRAEEYYRRSEGLEQRISPDSRPALRAMTRIYHGLLRKVAAKPSRVLHKRISLSLAAKLYIGWQAARGK